MSEKFPARSEVETRYTWDVEKIYASREDFMADTKLSESRLDEFEKKYKAKIAGFTEPAQVMAFVEDIYELRDNFTRQSAYVLFNYVTDKANTEAAGLYQAFMMKVGDYEARINLIGDELKRLDVEILRKTAEAYPEYKVFFEDIERESEHLLSPEAESVLANVRPLSYAYHNIYEVAKCTDMSFEPFELKGKSYPMSYVLFENVYCTHKDADVRREAFKSFSKGLAAYRNTIAAVYAAHVAQDVKMAKIKGYKDVFEYLLDFQHVTREMYDRQIDIIMSELAPVMRRFAAVQKRALGLDKMNFADLKALIDPDFSKKITVEEAKEYIEKAVALPGKEYRDMIMRFYDERWVDFPQNEGKESGGFCYTVPGVQPYILLNWSSDLSETFTLAHELGHAGQGLLTEKNCPAGLKDMSMYLVEAPSTFHELLLGESMSKEAEEAADERFKRFALSSVVANTYYHNFVTHLHEAAYQREVYKRAEAGESLLADDLDAIFRKVLEDFWGDAVEIEEGAELTWMRQPHYYMGLYSYTYSASLTISTNMLLRLHEEGEDAIEDWIKFLGSGSRMHPMDQAKMAGVDISTAEPLRKAIAYVESLVAEIEALTP